jgi:hypothetical protein
MAVLCHQRGITRNVPLTSEALNFCDGPEKGHSCKAQVFRRDSSPTRSRRSTGSGGESSIMLTRVEGNAVQAFSMLI